MGSSLELRRCSASCELNSAQQARSIVVGKLDDEVLCMLASIEGRRQDSSWPNKRSISDEEMDLKKHLEKKRDRDRALRKLEEQLPVVGGHHGERWQGLCGKVRKAHVEGWRRRVAVERRSVVERIIVLRLHILCGMISHSVDHLQDFHERAACQLRMQVTLVGVLLLDQLEFLRVRRIRPSTVRPHLARNESGVSDHELKDGVAYRTRQENDK